MLSHNARYELHPRESLDQRSGKGKERVGRRIRVLPRGMALMYPAPSVSHPPTLLSDILSSSPRLGLDTSGPGHFTATHESPFHTQAEYSSAQRASTAAPIIPLKRSLSQKLLSVEKRQISDVHMCAASYKQINLLVGTVESSNSSKIFSGERSQTTHDTPQTSFQKHLVSEPVTMHHTHPTLTPQHQ